MTAIPLSLVLLALAVILLYLPVHRLVKLAVFKYAHLD